MGGGILRAGVHGNVLGIGNCPGDIFGKEFSQACASTKGKLRQSASILCQGDTAIFLTSCFNIFIKVESACADYFRKCRQHH